MSGKSQSEPTRSRVKLPDGAGPPYGVYAGGVPQREGQDYRVEGGYLVFARTVEQEGELGFWRWLLMFFAIAGSYRKHESVDVTYQKDGKEVLATGLPADPFS